MTIFGLDVKLYRDGLIETDPRLDLVSDMFKVRKEREIFLSFLSTELMGGKEVFEEISDLAKEKVQRSIENGEKPAKDEVLHFIESRLKKSLLGSTNVYDQVLRGVIEGLEGRSTQVHNDLETGKIDFSGVPSFYPAIHKKGVSLLTGKIKDGINLEEESKYLVHSEIRASLRELAKEMFFVRNRLGLDSENLVSYLKILLELKLLEQSQPVKFNEFRINLGEALKNGTRLDLMHVKCLRFVYPRIGGVTILEDTADIVVDGVKGKYSPKSERKLFDRLKHIKDIFTTNGVDVAFHVCLADEDLDLLFPDGNNFVNTDEINTARQSIDRYYLFLKREYSSNFSFTTISTLAEFAGDKYRLFREKAVLNLRAGKGMLVDPNFFERDRVDHQYFYYQELLGTRYSRDEARRSVTEQMASVVALQELLPILGGNVLLIEEDRGGENKYIANGSRPVLFVKLRDEARFGIK